MERCVKKESGKEKYVSISRDSRRLARSVIR